MIDQIPNSSFYCIFRKCPNFLEMGFVVWIHCLMIWYVHGFWSCPKNENPYMNMSLIYFLYCAMYGQATTIYIYCFLLLLLFFTPVPGGSRKDLAIQRNTDLLQAVPWFQEPEVLRMRRSKPCWALPPPSEWRDNYVTLMRASQTQPWQKQDSAPRGL